MLLPPTHNDRSSAVDRPTRLLRHFGVPHSTWAQPSPTYPRELRVQVCRVHGDARSRLLRALRRCRGKPVPAPKTSRAENASAGRCSEPSSDFAAIALKDQEEIVTSRMTQSVGSS